MTGEVKGASVPDRADDYWLNFCAGMQSDGAIESAAKRMAPIILEEFDGEPYGTVKWDKISEKDRAILLFAAQRALAGIRTHGLRYAIAMEARSGETAGPDPATSVRKDQPMKDSEITEAVEPCPTCGALPCDQTVSTLSPTTMRGDEVERLRTALRKANANHEHFECEWYIRGDQIEQLLKASVKSDGQLETMIDRGELVEDAKGGWSPPDRYAEDAALRTTEPVTDNTMPSKGEE